MPAATWNYYVTFVYGGRGESQRGTASGNVTTAAGNLTVNLTNVPLGPTGCTARRIYRRDNAVTTNPTYFAVEISDNTTTTATDDNTNNDLARRTRNSAAIPPVSRYIVWHQNRLFVFWQTGDRSRFWWSELRTPDIILSTSFDYISRDDGDQITGAVSFRDRLFITKTRSCYALLGSSPNEWTLTEVDRKVGCSHNRFMQVTPRGVIFAGPEGVWIYDGVGIRLLSDAIEPLWRNVLQGFAADNRMEWTTLMDFTVGAASGGGSGSGIGIGPLSGSFASD